MNLLILGIGNVLLRDEGIGARTVMELERRFLLPPGVELLDGGTSGIELLRHIRGRDCLIILDAVKDGLAPGAVSRMEGREVPAVFRTRISPHQLGLSDLLAAAMLTGELPERVVLFGVEPESVDLGLEMTAPVRAGLERLIEAIGRELQGLGIAMTPRKTVLPEAIACLAPAA